MLNKVQMWGNSLAIRIPSHLAKIINISEGTQIELSHTDKSIVLTPSEKKEYTLKELLNKVTKDNIHGETHTGMAVGKEIIE